MGGVVQVWYVVMNFFIEMRSGYFSFDDIKWNYVVKFWFLVRRMRVCVLCVKAFFFFPCGVGGVVQVWYVVEDYFYLVEMRRGYLSFDDIKWNYVVKLWFLMVDYRSGARESKRRRWTTWYCSTRAPMTSYSPRLPNTNSSHPPFSPTVWGYFFYLFSKNLYWLSILCSDFVDSLVSICIDFV